MGQDTQLGAFKSEIDKRLNPNKMRLGGMSRAVHLANVAMHLVTQRDMIQNIGMVSPPDAFLAHDSLQYYLREPEKYGGICGDLQVFATHVFLAYGIESRSISMFEHVDYRDGTLNGHASTDIKINGKWSAIDLTFGFCFEGRLSWEEARHEMLSGNIVQRVKIGEGRVDMDTYYIGLEDLTQFMLISDLGKYPPFRTFGIRHGKKWDGKVFTNADEAPIDVANMLARRETLVSTRASLKA